MPRLIEKLHSAGSNCSNCRENDLRLTVKPRRTSACLNFKRVLRRSGDDGAAVDGVGILTIGHGGHYGSIYKARPRRYQRGRYIIWLREISNASRRKWMSHDRIPFTILVSSLRG